jgi:hypothetical protein
LKDTGPVVRFTARAQQPAALNDLIEATTSEFGTKRTSRPGLTMFVHRVERNLREWLTTSEFGPILLQKSKVASVRIFGEFFECNATDDSYNLSRAAEIACEFSVRR